jgi:hypothetical protein
VARSPSERGAELLSWPPDSYKDSAGTVWWFSALLTLTVQTVPFSPAFQVHLRSGVRRWATRVGESGLYLPPRRSTSVYLLADAPWLAVSPEGPESRAVSRFSVSRLTYDQDLGARRWEAGGPSGMLSRLRLARSFPAPADLTGHPEDWLHGMHDEKKKVSAAVVHSNLMGFHGVKAGLMPGDRVPLTGWFEQALPEGLERVADPVRALRHRPVRRRRTDPPDPGAADPKDAVARRRDLAGLCPDGQLRLHFLWNTTATREAGIEALRALLGLTGDGCGKEATEPSGWDARTWTTPELTVELRMAQIGALADRLALPDGNRVPTATLHAALTRRREQAAALMASEPATPAPALALLEIHERAVYVPRAADPKFALRLGFRDAGRVTQFVVTQRRPTGRPADRETNRARKLESCWLDGFRQLGHRPAPGHGLGTVLPPDLQYAALWLVKRRRDGPTRQADLVPLAVRVRPDAPAPERIEGWDRTTGAWLPYPRLLLRLAESAQFPAGDDGDGGADGEPDKETEDEDERDEGWDTATERRRRQVADAVQEVLFSLRDRPTLLLTHAQNARRLWPWLQNGEIEPDAVRLHGGPVQRLAVQGPELRLVRVREHTGTETPQWWGLGTRADTPVGREGTVTAEEAVIGDDGAAGERYGIAAGLWKPPDAGEGNRVFGSTAEKSGPGQKASTMASRWAFRPYERDGKTGITIDTDKVAWNPGLLEITVAGLQDGDDPELWATLTHRLRRLPGRTTLALPLPLHLARKAEEYVLPTTRDLPDDPDDDDRAVQLCFDLGVIAP